MYVVVVGVSAAVAILWREGEGEGREGGREGDSSYIYEILYINPTHSTSCEHRNATVTVCIMTKM